MLILFNTLSRKKEAFIPINKNIVGFYSCGPTVYWFQHIGNLRTYIFNDLLKRTLIYNGFKVKHVMNYTDVGHLTSDSDEGEDKMEKAAAKEHKSASEIANFYAKVFEEDCKKLNIIPPDIICKATEHINEQIELVKILEKKGFTYRTSDGIYFDTSKLDDYGKLAKLKIEGLEAGKRTEMREKINPTDFALWKFSEDPGKRQQEWDSPWGVGFPGWHIECSAMSSKYLGQQFDIHTGGEDHIPIHHTNEIAQSEAAFEKKPWVRYWVHGAFLTFKGEKVSKSKGGLFTISELQEKGFDPIDYRYFCLNTSYRKNLNFSLDSLEGAKNSYNKLKNIILELKSKKTDLENNKNTEDKNILEKYKKEFLESVNDDLNMPQALAVLWAVLQNKELTVKEKLELSYNFDKILGLGLESIKEQKEDVPQEIEKLKEQRDNARKNKDWKKSDELRDILKEKGWEVLDSKDESTLKKWK